MRKDQLPKKLPPLTPNSNKTSAKNALPAFAPTLRIDRYENIGRDARVLSKLILVCLGAGLIVSTALVMPNAASAIVRLLKGLEIEYWRIRRIIRRLKERRYITIRTVNGQSVLALTRLGQRVARQASIDILEIRRPRLWDKKWRIVVFDIPERKREARDILRNKLRSLGFARIQQSVWVLPWPCRAEMEFIRELYQLERYMTFWEVSDGPDFENVRQRFDL